MDKFYICTKSCTSLPVQYIAGKMYRMDEAGCIYGEDGCGRYPENTDSEFREATKIEIEIEKYFQGHWPGMETAEQCNSTLSFTPPAVKRLVEHFYNLGKDEKLIHSDDLDVEIEKYFHRMELRGDTPGIPDEYVDDTTVDKIARHFATWQKRQLENDYHYVTDHAIKMIQKSWYLEGWHDKKFDQPAQFEIGPDLEQKYHPSHMSVEDVQALIDRNYENGKKDKEEELMKDAISYKLIGRNNIEQLDMDELAKRGINWGDNIKVIILKDE